MKKNDWIKAYARFSQIGINMAITIIICILLGKWIDDKLSTTPIFVIIFIVLGIFSAFRSLYVLCIKEYKKETPEELIKNIVEREQEDDEDI